MKIGHYTIEIIQNSFREFYFTISVGNRINVDGLANSYKEAKDKAIVILEKIAKNIDDGIKMHKMKTYQKKPFKAFQWHSHMEHIDGTEFHNGWYKYNGIIIYNNDWILPETGEVISNKDFESLFKEVE